MGKALVLLGVALGVGLLVYWLASASVGLRGKPAVRQENTTTAASTPAGASADGTDARAITDTPAGSGPIAPPRTAQEKERDSLESRRAPLYARLRQGLGADLAAVRPSDDDAAALEIYATRDAPGNTVALLNIALRDNVAYYGFRHISVYTPNPLQSIERYRLDAEANADGNGNWQIFRK